MGHMNGLLPASTYTQLAADSALESPHSAEAVVLANAQLHDVPSAAAHPVDTGISQYNVLIESAGNQMTVFKELRSMADDFESVELLQAVRKRLERTQADLRSLLTVCEDETALLQLLATNEAVNDLLSAPLPSTGNTHTSPPFLPSPQVAEAGTHSSEMDELSDLLGVSGVKPETQAAPAPPTQFVKTQS